jgi:phosphoglycolate phosphatase
MIEMESRKFIKGSEIQILKEPSRGKIKHAVFDFDGTISLIRDGWQDVMVPQHVEELLKTPEEKKRIDKLASEKHVSVEIATEIMQSELQKMVIKYVEEITGKQTIYQMIELCDMIKQRGGNPLEAEKYKDEYHTRLLKQIDYRLFGLRKGTFQKEDWMLARSTQFLEELNEKGVICYLASGTDDEFVKDESGILGLAKYFNGGIYGAISDYKNFSKELVIKKRILEAHNLRGEELLVVGDGKVEIQIGNEISAVVLGVNSFEKNSYGMNADKKDRLINAGAQMLVPDFRDYKMLIEYLL